MIEVTTISHSVLTVDQPMLAWKEPQTCRFCCQEQVKESHLRKVSSRGHVAHFEILEHCLCQQHQLHTCDNIQYEGRIRKEPD